MTDDEIEEKLRSLSPAQLSGLIERLLRGDILTNGQPREFLELQLILKKEAKQQNKVIKHLLRGKGPQILKLIHESLEVDNLTSEERGKLERTADVLAGYLMSFWLPRAPIGKVLMFLSLTVGVIGAFQLSPWFGLFIPLGCLCSPRIVGEVLSFIGSNRK